MAKKEIVENVKQLVKTVYEANPVKSITVLVECEKNTYDIHLKPGKPKKGA